MDRSAWQQLQAEKLPLLARLREKYGVSVRSLTSNHLLLVSENGEGDTASLRYLRLQSEGKSPSECLANGGEPGLLEALREILPDAAVMRPQPPVVTDNKKTATLMLGWGEPSSYMLHVGEYQRSMIQRALQVALEAGAFNQWPTPEVWPATGMDACKVLIDALAETPQVEKENPGCTHGLCL